MQPRVAGVDGGAAALMIPSHGKSEMGAVFVGLRTRQEVGRKIQSNNAHRGREAVRNRETEEEEALVG